MEAIDTRNRILSKARLCILIGGLLMLFVLYNEISNSILGGDIEQAAIVILGCVVHLILIGAAFFKINGRSGKGWAEFSLIYGCLILLNGILLLLINPLNEGARILTGLSFIAAHAVKRTEKN